MKTKHRKNIISRIIASIRKMIAEAKARKLYNKEVKQRYKAGTRKVVLFNTNPLTVKGNFLTSVTDISQKEIIDGEFINHIEGKAPSYLASKETARARITPLKDNRLEIEFFNAKGLPTFDFTITKTVITNAFEKNLAEKTIYVIEQKRGNIIRYFKKEHMLAKKAIIGLELDNIKRDVKKNKDSNWVSLRYKTFSLFPAFRSHRFSTNMNSIKQSGFVITNTVGISQTQFEYIKPKSHVETNSDTKVAFA